MKLFFKNKFVLAPQSGQVVPLEKVKDPVFSENILGSGVAIIPSGNKVLSPINGKIRQLAKTYHSISVQGEDDLKILIHLGIDTFKLKGKGFNPKVCVGDKVSAGDELIEMDIEFIKNQGFDTTSPCIITDTKKLKKIELNYGAATAGETRIIKYMW